MQFCKLESKYHSREVYRELISFAAPQPTYVTYYRNGNNEGKSDEQIAEGLLDIAACGATLVDVIGDLYDEQEDEMARDPAAIAKQMELIDKLHGMGAEVLMSSHVLKFTPAERVLEMALEQQRRGADIAKIVTGASDMTEQLENLRIIDLLKKNLSIPFLFLAGGACDLHRRLGEQIGNCMTLCVQEYDELATKLQPLLSDAKEIRDLFDQ